MIWKKATRNNGLPRSRLSAFGWAAFWIGFSNLVFAIVLAVAANNSLTSRYMDFFRPKLWEQTPLAPVVQTGVPDDLVGLDSPDEFQPKVSLNITRVPISRSTILQEAPIITEAKSDHVADATIYHLADGQEGEIVNGPETPANNMDAVADSDRPSPEASPSNKLIGQQVSPILAKDTETGKLGIGNFKPFSVAGSSEECLDIGRTMLHDVGVPIDRLLIVTTSKLITIAKICASNGAIVISCRGQLITVSPRRSRPDDNCPA